VSIYYFGRVPNQKRGEAYIVDIVQVKLETSYGNLIAGKIIQGEKNG
jgi:hypothetical protein